MTTTVNVEHELARMAKMTTKELKLLYEEVFDEACRSNHRQWLTKRIIWRMQANAYGDLSERARRRAMEIADDRDLRMKAPTSKSASGWQKASSAVITDRDPRLPMPGVVITRRYKGIEHHVTVLDDGFRWQGEDYTSLSAVAKAITGSHMNGFRFFGLQQKRSRT